MGRATRIMIAAAERHTLDQQLVAHPGDVHGDAWLSAQAQRPLIVFVVMAFPTTTGAGLSAKVDLFSCPFLKP